MGKAGKAKKGLPTITFDDAKRTEFITGFHKRKNERRQHARRRIEREVKADKLQERVFRIREFSHVLTKDVRALNLDSRMPSFDPFHSENPCAPNFPLADRRGTAHRCRAGR